MKNILKWTLVCWLAILTTENSWSQTKTYTCTKEYNWKLAKILNFDKPTKSYGFKIVNELTGDKEIIVKVKTVDNIDISRIDFLTHQNGPLDLYSSLIKNASPSTNFQDQESYTTPEAYYTHWHLIGYTSKSFNNYSQTQSIPYRSNGKNYIRNRADIIARKFGYEGIWGFKPVNNINVEIELTVSGGASIYDLESIKLPGIEELITKEDFGIQDLVIEVYRDSDTSPIATKKYDFNDPYVSNNEMSIRMGDSISFKSSHLDFVVEGLPEIWIARTAGESKYMFTESVKPGEYRPFLGFDSQVHGAVLRKYPEELKDNLKYPGIKYDADTQLYSWYWIAQTNMHPQVDIYDPADSNNGLANMTDYKSKANFGDKQFGIGKDALGEEIKVDIQRNNQREGYNMQFLNAWKNTDTNNYSQFEGDNKYILGLDADEIIYVEGKDASISANTKPFAVLGVGVEEWKRYPAEGENVISKMVTAYQKNRTKIIDGIDVTSDFPEYKAQELYDKNTYIMQGQTKETEEPEKGCNNKPCVRYNSKGDGNITAQVYTPGHKLKFRVGDKLLNFDFSVTGIAKSSTLVVPPGFYGNLEGEEYPAENQKEVPYTLKNLKLMTVDERARLTMVYSHEDELGLLTTESRPYSSKNYSNENGWTEVFDMKGWGYNEITVYYQRSANATRVPIAGKELMEISLRFCSVPGSKYKDFSTEPLTGVDLNEGRGEGKFWYMSDFNDSTPANDTQYGGRDYRVTKSYTFTEGDEVTFNAMDSDPHTFFHYDTEWYVSERFMAKRLFPDRLGSTSDDIVWNKTDIDYTDGDGETIGWGRTLKYIWDKPGIYRLTANYHEDKFVMKITIVKREYSSERDKLKGDIEIYSLSPDQITWLNADPANENKINQDYKVAKVNNIFSKFTHLDGPRVKNYQPIIYEDYIHKDNRFGIENDFNADFLWYNTNLYDMENGTLEQGELNNTYFQDPRHTWFPNTWIRHYTEKSSDTSDNSPNLPDDIDVNTLNSLGGILKTPLLINTVLDAKFPVDLPESWQWRLPWISNTDHSAFRIRANIKAIYKMDSFFDNANGAFSGKGNTRNQSDENYKKAVSSPIPAFTGEEKTKYDFWADLNSQKKFIYNPSTTKISETDVWVKDGTDFLVDGQFIEPTSLIAGPGENQSSDFLKGADMSSVRNMEVESSRWRTSQKLKKAPVWEAQVNGVTSSEPYDIIKHYGANVARFRLWMDPIIFNKVNGIYVPTDKPYTHGMKKSVAEQMKRAKDKGFKILLDLHYSDTWADPEKNLMPSRWKTVKAKGKKTKTDNLATALATYTTNVLNYCKGKNAIPDYVQIGNETNSNIMMSKEYKDLGTKAEVALELGVSEANLTASTPVIKDDTGNVLNPDAYKYTINWDRNARLLNAGLQAVKNFNSKPENAANIKTMLHIAGPDNAVWWLNQAFNPVAKNDGLPRLGSTVVTKDNVDVIGISYYQGNNGQTQSLSRLKQILEGINSDWGKETLIVETGFPFSNDFNDVHENTFGLTNGIPKGVWPKDVSPDLQRQWLVNLRETLKVTNGAIGFLYWEPFWVGTNDITFKDDKGSPWENMTFFDLEPDTANPGKFKPKMTNPLNTTGGILAFCDQCPVQPGQPRISEGFDKTIVDDEVKSSILLYPNPSEDGEFFVAFELQKAGAAQLQIHDLTGRLIYQTKDQTMYEGKHQFLFDKGTVQLPSGTYIVKITSNEFNETRKLIVK